MLIDKPIKNIVSGDLIQRQINVNTKKYSSKSVHNQNGFVSAVLKHFRIHTDAVSLPPKQYVGIPVPTETEAKAICAYLRECPRIECQALLALTCSLRQSEIAALTAADVHGNDVFIHGARIPNKDNHLVYNPFGKSDAATRHVQMPKYLEEQVEKWKKSRPNGWLFPTKPDQVLYYFEKMERSHGMPAYTMHSLRHCFAAVMHALNVPDQYIMQLGGWKSDFVLKRVYRYALAEKTAEVKNNANIHFSKMMSETSQTTNQTTSTNAYKK
jgi:integrase